jgi:hypothetical protein
LADRLFDVKLATGPPDNAFQRTPLCGAVERER